MKFYPKGPGEWSGRYMRIPGDGGTFHVRARENKPGVAIDWKVDDEIGQCWALESAETQGLTKSVIKAKRMMGGGPGGEFIINEFGQVIVPGPSGDGRRLLVGLIKGNLLFENPFDNSLIDLSDDSGLRCGDKWTLPYIGFPYNLSGGNKIYFYRVTASGGQTEYLDSQDSSLIARLRKIRSVGAVRFIANHHGIVLTKKPRSSSSDQWDPIYVGKLDYEHWFDKEE